MSPLCRPCEVAKDFASFMPEMRAGAAFDLHYCADEFEENSARPISRSMRLGKSFHATEDTTSLEDGHFPIAIYSLS